MIETEQGGTVRTFDELDAEEQARAERVALDEELLAVVEGAIRFNDEANRDDLQARIDRAREEMEQMQTPWFLGEHLMEDETIAETLYGLARSSAEGALYASGPVHVLRLER